MKILMIAQSADLRSGWGRYTRSVTEEVAKRGYEYKVIASKAGVKHADEENVLLPANSVSNVIKNSVLARKFAKDCDLVHAFDVWPFSIYGYAAVIGTSKKLFITGVGTYSVPPKGISLKRLILSLALKRAVKVMCSSDYTRGRILESVALDNTVTVYWGRSKLPQVQRSEIENLNKKFDLSTSSSPVIITVGQIKHRKGQFNTLGAIKILKEKYPDILYIMVGSTVDEVYIKKIQDFIKENKLENNARIVDNAKTDEDLAFFYSIADIFAMNSNNYNGAFEGFGLVFLEAEGFGKPCVGSKDCGIQEAIQDGYNGYLTEQQNEQDIAGKIGRILSGDIKKMGQNSLEFYARFSWEKTVGEYTKYYEGR